MSENKHTQGEWKARKNGRDTYIYTGNKGHKGGIVAKVSKQQNEYEANAKLMAASPELLDTLEELLKSCKPKEGTVMGARSIDSCGIPSEEVVFKVIDLIKKVRES